MSIVFHYNRSSSSLSEPDDGCYTSDESLETFTLFPRLPPELREQIWEKALPGESSRSPTGRSRESFLLNQIRRFVHGQSRLLVRNYDLYTPDFSTKDKDIGMLRACAESQEPLSSRLILCPYHRSAEKRRFASTNTTLSFSRTSTISLKVFVMPSSAKIQSHLPSKNPKPGFLCLRASAVRSIPARNNMFRKLATMDRGSLEVILGIFTATETLVLISDGLKKITRNGICEEFEMGKKACDRHDTIAQQFLGAEASRARNRFLRNARSFRPFGISRTPKVLIMARKDKVHEERENPEVEKKNERNLLLRGGRRLVRRVKKLTMDEQ
ncbi:hypothetical protein BKA64DRAFT_707272 [Cadophora sp. MPI-SDFR-AT-0126]|nr:hypothetical protein BKA64DRAFT_707272 [Leotiomycetes sp. MPI-SDFR-AT-0126]